MGFGRVRPILRIVDAFPPTCDPAAYVPRRATEEILGALENGFQTGRGVMALSGPGGLGKTMILRVLGARLGRSARCLHLPYAALGTEDLVAWVLGLLGREPTTADPETALYWTAHNGPPLVLMLDDASAMPVETGRDLARWTADFAGALRLVVVPVDDDRTSRVLAALGEDVLDLRLAEPMTEAETRGYVAARIARVPDPEPALVQLSEDRAAWLHRESAGNPRVLHGLATWLLYSDRPVPGAWKASSEHWLETDSGEGDFLEVDTGALVPVKADPESELESELESGWAAALPEAEAPGPRPAPRPGTEPAPAPRRAAAPGDYSRRRRRRRR